MEALAAEHLLGRVEQLGAAEVLVLQPPLLARGRPPWRPEVVGHRPCHQTDDTRPSDLLNQFSLADELAALSHSRLTPVSSRGEHHDRGRHRRRRPNARSAARTRGRWSTSTPSSSAEVAVGAAIDRSGIPTDDIDDIVLAESLQGGGVIARYMAVELGLDCGARPRQQPPLRGRPRRRADRGRIDPGGHGLGGRGRGHREPQLDPVIGQKSVPASAKDPQLWMSPSHPETPDAPPFDMAITVGENTARIAGVTREAADEWAYHSHLRAAAARDEGWFDRRDRGRAGARRRRRHAGVRPRRAPAGRTPRSRSSRRCRSSTPSSRGATVTAGNAAGLNDAAAAVVVVSDEYAGGPRAHAAGPHRVVGVGRRSSPCAPASRRPSPSRRRSTGPACRIDDIDLFEINEAFCYDGGGVEPGARPRPRHRERQRQRLRPRAPDRRHRRPHGRDACSTSCAAGTQTIGLRRHVRRRRHGLGPGPRAPLTLPSPPPFSSRGSGRWSGQNRGRNA